MRAEVQSGQLRAFLSAIGDPRPVEAFGRSAVPPTFVYCLAQLWAAEPAAVVRVLGLDGLTVLHAAQGFRFHRPVRLGDVLEYRSVTGEAYSKRGGTRIFVPVETVVTGPGGLPVCDMSQLLVVMNG